MKKRFVKDHNNRYIAESVQWKKDRNTKVVPVREQTVVAQRNRLVGSAAYAYNPFSDPAERNVTGNAKRSSDSSSDRSKSDELNQASDFTSIWLMMNTGY